MDRYQQALDVFDGMGGNNFESNIDKKLYLAKSNQVEKPNGLKNLIHSHKGTLLVITTTDIH